MSERFGFIGLLGLEEVYGLLEETLDAVRGGQVVDEGVGEQVKGECQVVRHVLQQSGIIPSQIYRNMYIYICPL